MDLSGWLACTVTSLAPVNWAPVLAEIRYRCISLGPTRAGSTVICSCSGPIVVEVENGPLPLVIAGA
jgi:hypothetical protein